jgi:hypothetical protein
MTSIYKKKCSTSLATTDMQITTTLTFHLTPVRMAVIKGNNNHKCWRGCGEMEPLNMLVGMQISTTTSESSLEIPQKAKARTAI